MVAVPAKAAQALTPVEAFENFPDQPETTGATRGIEILWILPIESVWRSPDAFPAIGSTGEVG
jgi:hypothetical protein